VGRLLGLGDIEGLLEKFRALEESEKLEKRMRKALAKGEITLPDLYLQIKSILRMGPLAKILQMIPGLANLPLREDDMKISEKTMRKWLHIIESMTEEELKNPGIIDRSRMRRIAIGSGTNIEDVKQLLLYYQNMNRLMRDLKRKRLSLPIKDLKDLESLEE